MFKFLGTTTLSLGILGCGGGSDGSGAGLQETNLAPSIPDLGLLFVQEGSMSVVKVNAMDGDSDRLTYSISGGDDSSFFAISSSGTLSFTSAPDFESPEDDDRDNTYVLTIEVSDGSLSDTQHLRVSVSDAFEGRVAFAPMSGATVFVDMNGNGRQDENEPSGVTDHDGFFRTALFELFDDSTVQVVSMGGTDTTTDQLLPQLVLLSEVSTNSGESAHLTALTTLLSSIESTESKNGLLAALGVEQSLAEILTSSGWQSLAGGDPRAMFGQRVNRQVTLLQQTAVGFVGAFTGLADQSVLVVRALAREMVKVANSERALDLTSASVIEGLLEEAFAVVSPSMRSGATGLPALARSVAMVNAVTADPALDPRSDIALDIARASQGVLLAAVSDLALGKVNTQNFGLRTEPSQLFRDVALSQEALDTDLDGIADAIDPDNDGDDVPDGRDRFPLDPDESQDSDVDGIGNNADLDDDNDGVQDDVDSMPLDKYVHTLPTTAPQQMALALLPKASNTLTGRLASTSQDNRPVTYSIATQAAHGSATLTDAATGGFSYVTTADTVQSDSFSYVVNDGYVDSAPSTVSLSLLTDPLYKHQWHLANTGQENFANAGGRVGADMNVSEVIAAGYSGQGVVVAIVDTGLEIAHEDLIANVVSGSYDFVEGDTDPTRQGSGVDHGTAVAGIIGARGWNSIGPRGVAPKVSLKGYNWLLSQSTANWISAFGGESYSEDVDIFNNSWGSASRTIDDPLKTMEETTFNVTLPAMRGGKGAIFVKSAGNYFNRNSNSVCGSTNGGGGLSCRDVNQDSTHNNPNIIVVSALNADGTRSSYSSVGSAIWVSAPGGESGSRGYGGKPAVMTTDIQGCAKGYVGGRGDGANEFDSKSSPHAENTNCNYTSTMNGTSSAAPNVSGAIALMLEANPQLTLRDVKHILAETSRQVDADAAPVVVDGITYHEWVTNAAGFTYHNYYGFGGIDVAAAVGAAKGSTVGSLADRSKADWISSGTIDLDVGFGATVAQALYMPTSGIVEYVLVRLTMTHEDPSEVGFRLTSPSGTTTTIWQPYVAASTAIESKVAHLSASAFYGESMTGDWTLSAYDHKSGKPMTLHSYEIKIDYR
jgi:subtilisin family serine protease